MMIEPGTSENCFTVRGKGVVADFNVPRPIVFALRGTDPAAAAAAWKTIETAAAKKLETIRR